MKTTNVIIIALITLITLTGIATADQGVTATPSAAGITSQVSIDCEGIVMTSSSLGWSLTDQNMFDDGLATRGNTLGTTMLDTTQVKYSTTYDSSTIAQNGHTTYVKTMAIGTGNKLLTQSNVKADTSVTFVATGDGGNILGTENIMIDGTGMPTSAGDRMLCPFGSAGDDAIPAYCNIVMAGSRYDLTIGSVVTSANDRFVGTDATAPVVLNYAIDVKPYIISGQGTSPAMGAVSSYFKASIKEGRTGYWGNVTDERVAAPLDYDYIGRGEFIAQDDWWLVFGPTYQPVQWDDVMVDMAIGTDYLLDVGPQNEDLTYSESSSAAGIITSYSAAYQYQSGKALLP